MKLANPTNAFEEGIHKNIEKHGYQLTGVVDPKGDNPSFMYSIGFWFTYGHPEIIILGLHSDVAISIFGTIADHLKGGGQQYEISGVYEEFIEGYECTFISVKPIEFKDYLLSNIWLYEGDGFPVLQLVFQDENHLWPWDEKASDKFVLNQPLLGG